jgi:hypothetical protein
MKIGDKRIHSIYWELKRIDCNDYTNACATLLRVFLELSLDGYIEEKHLGTVTIDDKLSKKVDKV